MLGEGPTDDINGSIGAAGKKFSINFSKANTKFCLSLHCNNDNSYLLVNGKKIYKFKADKCQLSNSMFSFEDRLKDFSVDYDAIDKSEILNINKYVMVNNNIK